MAQQQRDLFLSAWNYEGTSVALNKTKGDDDRVWSEKETVWGAEFVEKWTKCHAFYIELLCCRPPNIDLLKVCYEICGVDCELIRSHGRSHRLYVSFLPEIGAEHQEYFTIQKCDVWVMGMFKRFLSFKARNVGPDICEWEIQSFGCT
jgi:hypothetical protein